MQDEMTGPSAEVPGEPRVHDADYMANTMADGTKPHGGSGRSHAVSRMCRDEVDPFDDISEYEENGGRGEADAYEELARYEQDMEMEFLAAYGDSNDERGSPMNEQETLYASEKARESDGPNSLAGTCSGAKSLKDRTVEATPKIDSAVMNGAWKAASFIHTRDEADEPPPFIAASAAYKSDPEGAKALARTCDRTMSALESFYCMCYKIDLEDREYYKRRRRSYIFRDGQLTREGGRTDTICKYESGLVKQNGGNPKQDDQPQTKGTAERHVDALVKAARRLVLDGIPGAGNATPAAELHRSIWAQRMGDLKSVDTEILEGMAWQAENERQAAAQRDLREGARTYAKWLAMAEKEPGILYKITRPPARREEEIATTSGVICCPTEIVDLKAEAFKATWTDPGNPRERR
ncbi:unnamed protein product [Prorocentrum cordatum]|uniref:Uncharacterized protein n=1 Tax=Prorocentrum cordatum TaxID=2364126 RepID=A0ABN9WWR7_9DINO|nr:unnamed protein product [Polarella glacialis]